jgi:hypothetical protein
MRLCSLLFTRIFAGKRKKFFATHIVLPMGDLVILNKRRKTDHRAKETERIIGKATGRVTRKSRLIRFSKQHFPI